MEEYKVAYAEVLEILANISYEDYVKIPKEKIDMFRANADTNCKFKYEKSLTLNEQKVSKRAQAVLAILFRDYWATEEQKDLIDRKRKYDLYEEELRKKEKYNVDTIFRKTENLPAKYEEKIWNKFYKKLKEIFRRNKNERNKF